jgi:tetratricopeptide (TPR) repeat protein
MSSKNIYLFITLIFQIIIGHNFASAEKNYQNQEPISHDSLASLNEYALLLIYTNPDSANVLADIAYKLSLKQNDSTGIALSLTTLGAVNWAEAKFNLALRQFFDALAKYEALNDTTGILRCYNNIAEVYKKLKSYSNAERYLFKARNLHNHFFLEKFPVLNNLNLAELYLEQKVYDSAANYLAKAKKAPQNQLTINYLAAINYNYALLNKDTSNFDLANVFISQSIQFAEMENNERRLAECYNLLGEILFELNKHEKAVTSFKKALKLALKLKHEHLELRIHKNLYILDFERGKTINAITHILRYAELKDKIYTISIVRQSAEFETVYEFEKIEKENSLLQIEQAANDNIIKYQIGFIILALIALVIAVYLILAINKQRKTLKEAIALLEEKSEEVETQKLKIEKQARKTNALNRELTLLNKNLESRAHEIAREIEVKNKKMNKYAFMNAHKLRAPIASILGLINLFGKGLGGDDENTMIIMLKDSAHKLDKVVHEIKDVIDE